VVAGATEASMGSVRGELDCAETSLDNIESTSTADKM